MRTEAVRTVLGLERSRITPGVAPLKSEAEIRASLLGISGSIASSSETPVNRVLLNKKSLAELSPRKRGYHDRNGKWVLYRRSGRGGRCARIPHDSPEGCPTPERCRKARRSIKTEDHSSKNIKNKKKSSRRSGLLIKYGNRLFN